MPPVIKGEEAAEGEGRACGAEPPPETARHREEREAAWLAPPFLPPSLSPFHGLFCRVAAAAFLPSLFRLSNTQNDSAPWLPLTGMSLPGSACRCRPAVRQSCTYLRLPPPPTTKSGDGEGRRPPCWAALRALRLPSPRRGREGGRCCRLPASRGARRSLRGEEEGARPRVGRLAALPGEAQSGGWGRGGRPSREVVVEIKGRRGEGGREKESEWRRIESVTFRGGGGPVLAPSLSRRGGGGEGRWVVVSGGAEPTQPVRCGSRGGCAWWCLPCPEHIANCVCVYVCVCLSLSIPGDCTLKIHSIQCTSLTQPQTLVLGRWRTRRCFLEGAAAVAAAAAALLLPLRQVPALGALPSPPRIISHLCWSSRHLHLLQQLQQRVHSRHPLIHKA